MQFTSRNRLALMLALQLALVAVAGVAAFDLFGKNKVDKAKKGKAEPEAEPEAAADKGTGSGKNLPDKKQAGELDELQRMTAPTVWARAETNLNAMRAVKNQQLNRMNSQRQRIDLDKVREATDAQQRIEREHLPKRPTFGGNKNAGGGGKDANSSVQGKGRRKDAQRRAQEEAEAARRAAEGGADDDDDDDDVPLVGNNRGDAAGAAADGRQATADRKYDEELGKFVSTVPKKRGPGGVIEPNLDFLKPNMNIVKQDGGSLINGQIKKNKLITSSYWQKGLEKAYKKTKKGFKEGATFMSDLPKHLERGVDSINAFLQLDSKGKVLALMEEVAEDARFVRREFSQFTLSWSQIMEKGLEYVGDEHLDKLAWNKNDELDHRRDALDSLAIGFEFMKLLIIWRENLLMAHGAFRLWLESVKTQVVANKLELDESVVMQLRTTHTYMLLTAWMNIEEEAKEARTRLDYLMEIEDDRPKNYESEYFRNIVVLKEMYVPTLEELERERHQVVDSISESGVVVDNLKDVDEFVESFRTACREHKIGGNIEWEVPQELSDFMNKLEPQLRKSSLIYTKHFLHDLKARLAN